MKTTRLEKQMSELLKEAIEMTGEPDCYLDHHGYCQAHNLQPADECWVKIAKDLISEVSGEN